ncbi:MAG: NAD(P)/FAD-dependent oxidoreductase [Spirochaetales bacterium]|nr:NAD(P)/FAD-dependent oxidoreductase [Spirochaetales bacterium]
MPDIASPDRNPPAPFACLVVGGGPAGLFAAVSCADALAGRGLPPEARRVAVLEKGPRAGRKLLASGSGQCNLTHDADAEELLDHYGGPEKGRFLKPALHAFPPLALLAWFRERSLEFSVEANGKVFPASRKALDVLRVLEAEALALGVEIRPGARAASVARYGDAFAVAADGSPEPLRALTLVLATGGRSYPKLGSEGDGYALAAALGHRLVEPRPALASLSVKDYRFADYAGLSFPGARFSVRRGGRKSAEHSGDVLLTHEGLSGPGILDASRGITPGDSVELELAGLSPEAFRERLSAELSRAPTAYVKNAVASCGVPKRLAEGLVEMAGAEPWVTGATLRREHREALVRLTAACPFEVEALAPWDEAMATAGGVALADVSPKTMESRLAPGLYFAGELLDLDGDSGGYNLQAAFSTGALAGRSAAAKLSV